MTSRSTLRRISALAAVLAASACGSGMLDVGHSTGPSGGGGGGGATASSPSSYVGVIADSSKHGHLTITVSTTLTTQAIMTFIGGPTVTLNGTVDTVAQQLIAAGGGYNIIAFPFHGTIQGHYTGPAGTATGFLAASSDSLTLLSHVSYCGTYTSSNGNGWMSMVILSDGDTGGMAVQTSGGAASSAFTGTLINGISFTGSTNAGAPIIGTLSGSTMTGTYAPPIGSTAGSGSFTVSSGGC